MEEYHKIESLFIRDMEGTKKLMEGQFRNELVEYLKDCEWIFTEKIDGTNIRIHWDGHTVTFGGRTDNAVIPEKLLNEYLIPTFSGEKNEQVFEQLFGESSATLYGEGYGAKIQKGGGLYRQDNAFILFDVKINGVFLERHSVEDIAKAMGIDVVPVVLRGTIQEGVDFVKDRPSSVVSQEYKEMEGIVGIPRVRTMDIHGNRVIVKIKCEDFE